MSLLNRSAVAGICALAALAAARPAWAQDEPTMVEAAQKPQFGAGLRIRYVTIPAWLQNLFLDHSNSMSHIGFGGEFVRRKGDFDIVVGVEYENISPPDGLYQEQGDDPGIPGQYPDYTEFDGLGLLGADVSFIWHANLHPKVQFRYGAGIGIGLVLGNIYQTDTVCPAGTTVDQLDDPNRCPKAPGAPRDKADKPPVVPIVNVLLGFRFKVNDQISINLEGGFRDMFFFGLGTNYMF